jgi:multisubunit Na+/H+ antiporter MnhE subunit
MLMSILLSTAYLLFWYVFHTMTAMVVTLVIGLILALISKLVSARIMAPVRENA